MNGDKVKGSCLRLPGKFFIGRKNYSTVSRIGKYLNIVKGCGKLHLTTKTGSLYDVSIKLRKIFTAG
jgi:hypothetical protein